VFRDKGTHLEECDKIKCTGKCKGKFHSIKGHEGPEGEYSYNDTLSLTSEPDGGGWSSTRHGRFISGKEAHCTEG
jgi:hypothetical protein